MKKDWEKRLKQIETQSRFVFGKQRFEKWLQTNQPNFKGDLWGLYNIVPEEFRMECLFWILDQMRDDQKVL